MARAPLTDPETHRCLQQFRDAVTDARRLMEHVHRENRMTIAEQNRVHDLIDRLEAAAETRDIEKGTIAIRELANRIDLAYATEDQTSS